MSNVKTSLNQWFLMLLSVSLWSEPIRFSSAATANLLVFCHHRNVTVSSPTAPCGCLIIRQTMNLILQKTQRSTSNSRTDTA